MRSEREEANQRAIEFSAFLLAAKAGTDNAKCHEQIDKLLALNSTHLRGHLLFGMLRSELPESSACKDAVRMLRAAHFALTAADVVPSRGGKKLSIAQLTQMFLDIKKKAPSLLEGCHLAGAPPPPIRNRISAWWRGRCLLADAARPSRPPPK